MTRSEAKASQAAERSYRNAKAILDICVEQGMSDELALAFAISGIDFRSFEWFLRKAGKDRVYLKRMIERRLARIEANRRTTLLGSVQPKE
jgi:hypothetical protein